MKNWIQQTGVAPRVLVVEDDAGIRETLRDVLELEGCDVAAASDGESGFAAARSHQPDLIVSDILMPGVDGYEMLARLRQLPEFGATPVIFLTARANATDVRQGMECGADDYLVKPFEPERLLRAVEARLRRRRASEAMLAQFRESVAAMLPHELRTPLAGVIGFSELLLEAVRDAGASGAVAAETVSDHARYIRESGQRLLRLVERYTLWVELTMRGEELRAKRPHWDTLTALPSVTERAQALAAERGRAADLSINLAAARLAVPDGYLPAIVGELVDNALKFSRPGQPVRVEGAPSGQDYALSVADAGRGLPTGSAARIAAFVQFERHRWEQQGTGLGLAIAQRFCTLVEGELQIVSRPQGGDTRVLMRLPLVPTPR